MGIVLPDSILGSPGLGYIREWLIKNHRIIGSVDLHADTFQPRNGTQTSVLFLQKKTQEQKDAEEKAGTMADYNIFMAMVEKVGHDKRGTPTFKRDKEGNEINYHILKTTYYEADPNEVKGLNVDALGVLFNPENANSCKEMKIKDWDAALYEFDELSYLCWTDTPEASYVLEYNPDAIPDEEILKMAESAEVKNK